MARSAPGIGEILNAWDLELGISDQGRHHAASGSFEVASLTLEADFECGECDSGASWDPEIQGGVRHSHLDFSYIVVFKTLRETQSSRLRLNFPHTSSNLLKHISLDT